MSPVLRAAVTARRKFPDGELHYINIDERGGEEVFVYPWPKMKLGDFFFVPLRGRSPSALSVRFRQAAARRDWELTVVKLINDGEPSLRVCLTLMDVSDLKRKAQHHHGVDGIRFSDGKWAKTRKARANRASGSPKLKVISADPTKRTEPFPFRQEYDQGLGEDATLSPGYDGRKLLQERLAALKATGND